jgi:nucleotide-binding universal stress UspA family protein
MSYTLAVGDFREARRRASMEQIVARLRGQPVDLLSYEDVRRKLRATVAPGVELKEIPLDAIVGSVGRYSDFTRSFLPRHDSNEERWARVQLAVTNSEGVPPIEVYEMGDVYFVRDGHHRVSVARQLGSTAMQAYVTQVKTRVPLTPGVRVEDLWIKAEYAEFLEQTNLDDLRPEANLEVTEAGQYAKLEEHIAVHHYFMGLDLQRDVSYQEAVAHWYDDVYLPVVELIRSQGVLHEFPTRTETDLYLWLLDHRAALEEALGWEVQTASVAQHLAAEHSLRARRLVARTTQRIREAVLASKLEGGPPPGSWREERVTPRAQETLFPEILVPVSGQEAGWQALTQAAEVARREDGRLSGLHVVANEAELQSQAAAEVEDEFYRRCEAAGVPGKLSLEVGRVASNIRARARWADLVVVQVAHPPGPWALARLSSGLRTLLLTCPRPVLAVPGDFSPLSRALLAYDGSPKAEEALFIAAYLAGRWQTSLVVLTVVEGRPTLQAQAQAHAREYLESHGVEAEYLLESGPVDGTMLGVAGERECNLVLMGGYGHGPAVEVVVGSAVDTLLRESRSPVLICR